MSPALIATISSTYDEAVVDKGNQPLLLLLVAFGVTFGITRFITHSIRSQRFSWLGDVEAGDTHIHHLVWGIILLLVSGFLAVGVQPPLEVTAIVFGVGAALTLDEFALWLHLDDVYWSEEGRQSIDAVIIFAIVTGFMAVGAYPISSTSDTGLEGALDVVLTTALGFALAIGCFLKGKLMWGVVGIYFFPASIVGLCRLARPDSRWAKKRYDAPKLERARKRYAGERRIHKPRPDG